VKLPSGGAYQQVKATVKEHRLSTVCEEAMCPNLAECWNAGTATIMLMGSVCTRACRFCAVDTGNPRGRLDPDEPRLAAESVFLMGLTYVVLTSVDRDDLPDGGASHYAALRPGDQGAQPRHGRRGPDARLPGRARARAAGARQRHRGLRPERRDGARLTHPVRDPRASYEQTLDVLAYAKRARPDVLTKTSLMLGLGETDDEIRSRPCATCAPSASTSSPSGSTCGPPRRTCRSSAGSRPRSSPRTASRASRWASSRWSRARWCARATARSARWRRTTWGLAPPERPRRRRGVRHGRAGGRARRRRLRRPASPRRLTGELPLVGLIDSRISAWVSSMPCQSVDLRVLALELLVDAEEVLDLAQPVARDVVEVAVAS
jgi:hypothetical protein